MSGRYFLGVDPGISGGIALIGASNGLAGESYETFKLKDATERDVWDWFERMPRPIVFARIEKVGATPQMGVVSAFTFGRNFGFLRGVLIASRIAFDEISPQKWQKFMGCLTHGDKNVSKAKAQQLFPSVKITHANADALLLAEYARRTYVRNDMPIATASEV